MLCAAHLDTVPGVHLGLALVVLPDDAELDDALRNLNDRERLAVRGVLFEEGGQAGGELIASLSHDPG